MTPTDNEQDLRSRVVSLEHGHTNMNQRMTEFEKWRQTNDIADAKMQVKVENMNEKMTAIMSNTTWLLRLVIGGLIMAVIGFALRGGFHIP